MADTQLQEEQNPWEQPSPSPEFMQQPLATPEPPQFPSAGPWDQSAVESAFTPQGPNPFKPEPRVPFAVPGRLGMVDVDPNDSPFHGFGRDEKSYGKVHDVAMAAERGIRRFLGPGFNEAASKVSTVGTMIAPGSGEYEGMQGSVKTKQAIEEGHYGEAAKEGSLALLNSTFGSLPGGALITKSAVAAGAIFGAMKAPFKPTPGLAEKIAAEPGFIDTSQFKGLGGKIGGKLGFWPGGIHMAPDGTAFYLKTGPSIEQVKNENLGSKIYALAGTPVAEVGVTHIKGQPGIASKMLPNSYQLSEWKKPYNELPGLHENFVVDAWVANHDAPGTGWENNMGNIMISNGVATRIDTGGSLSFKGSGQPKTYFNDEADEIFSMRDPNFSETNHKVYGGISEENLKIGAQKVADVDPKAIADVISRYGPTDFKEATDLYEKLLKRRQYIMDHFGVQPKEKAPPPQFNDPSMNLWPAEWNKAPAKPEAIPEGQIGKNISEDDWNDLLAAAPPKQERMVGEKDFSEGQFGEAALKDQRYPPLTQEEVLASAPPVIPEAKSGIPKFLVEIFDDEIAAKELLTKKLPKTHLKDASTTMLHDGFSDGNHWQGALNLWKVAEQANPQLAEALFRELPASVQPKVGYAISALKNELGYSPFDSIANGSGKDGKFPSEYNYYSTKTTAYQVPDHIKNSTAFQSNIKNNAQKLLPPEAKIDEPAPVAAPAKPNIISPSKEIITPKEFVNSYYSYNAKFTANKLVSTYDGNEAKIANAMYRYATDKSPEFVDNIYKKLPFEIQVGANGELQQLIDKFGDPWAKNFKNKVPSAEGKKILSFLEPIKDWQSYTPTRGKFEIPVFPDAATKKRAEATGHNIMTLLWKGHYKPQKYPEEIKDFSKKETERANFLTHEKAIAASKNYGPAKAPYVARGDKVFRVDYQDLFGKSTYEGEKVHDVVEAARSKNADLLVIDNIKDYGHFLGSGFNHKQTQYAFINQNVLRAPTAKFDPSMLHLAKPFLGLTGGGLFVYGASSKDDKMNRGGTPLSRIKAYARGGPGSAPWNVRQSSHPKQPAGMIKSDIPGRTDKLNMSVPSGSFIMPADIPSALGEGNTMSGEKILGAMFKSGPYGPPSTQSISGKLPKAKSGMSRIPKMGPLRKTKFADGGETTDVPIVAAGGEYILYPEQVREAGHGDLEAGHKVLNNLVLNIRKRNIRTLSKLKPPKMN